MDTSEQYIKMCEKAKEIQAKWQHQDGDFYFTYADDDDDIIGGRSTLPRPDSWTDWGKYHHIWLPRQDQLQAMCGDNFREVLLGRMGDGEWKGLDGFVDFAYEDCRCESMEQLWLAFVEKEKYGKAWDGEDWVKEA